MSRGPLTLCGGPETPIEWKCESVSDQMTNELVGVGAKKIFWEKLQKISKDEISTASSSLAF